MNLKDYFNAPKEAGHKSQRAVAKDVGVTPGMVNQWVSGYRDVAAERVLAIETSTGGKVTRHELRPDIYPREAA